MRWKPLPSAYYSCIVADLKDTTFRYSPIIRAQTRFWRGRVCIADVPWPTLLQTDARPLPRK